jgi:hypothetical protein
VGKSRRRAAAFTATPEPAAWTLATPSQIIAGAAILAIYMLMCVFHRALLAPSKA